MGKDTSSVSLTDYRLGIKVTDKAIFHLKILIYCWRNK